jgi:hypothetical protein
VRNIPKSGLTADDVLAYVHLSVADIVQAAKTLTRQRTPALVTPAFGDEAEVDRAAEFAVSVENDAVDGAHSSASKCHRVVAPKRTTNEGSRPWARLARSVSISRSQFFRFMGWMPMAQW